MAKKIEFTKIQHDVNGNPRWVCSFSHFITAKDNGSINEKYTIAIRRAKKVFGKKFHNNHYPMGIVFQTFNIHETEKEVQQFISTL